MRTLLVTALLLALPGVPRAEGGAPPAPAEEPAKPQQPRAATGGGKAGKDAARKVEKKAGGAKTDPKADAKEKDGAKGAGAPGEKPCEPVKPCPIDG